MLRALLLLAAAVYSAQAFSQNAIGLGLVSVRYPLSFWDSLANMTEAELNPEFRRLVLFLDRTRAGDDHWCCHNGRVDNAKTPVYNNRGVIVAYNTVPCEKVGCCDKFLEIANHCLDKKGQDHLVTALEIARARLGSEDTADLIKLLKGGGLVG